MNLSFLLPLAQHDHSVGNLGVLGWILVGVAALLVIWVIWKAVAYTVHPGEEDPHHIKRQILEDPAEPGTKDHPTPPEATPPSPDRDQE